MAGQIQGPSVCGKIELLKGLSINLGHFLFIANCNNNINYLGFRSVLKGALQLGAWCVFKDILDLDPRVLSVASLDLRHVLMASGQHQVNFHGEDIKLHDGAALFVTLSTADERGYSNRLLPACLRCRFRPVTITQTDARHVIEIILISEGIQDPRDFALKICRLFELCELHLGHQMHYDFSVRKIIHVAKQIGNKKCLMSKISDEELILQAIITEVEPQLLPDDRLIFLEYVADLFPGVETPKIDQTDLSIAIENVLINDNLIPLAWSVSKCLQIIEALSVRNCVFLVGKSGSGKTTAWRTLSKALNKLLVPGCNQVQVHTIYPNALKYTELYGEFNEETSYYKNGIITEKLREISSDSSGNVHWMLFDGKVVDSWIDGIVGVLSTSVLTTGSGENIRVSSKIKFIFEMEALESVSPALISLCGCVYFDHNKLGYQPYLDAWLKRLEDKTLRQEISILLKNMLDKSLEFKEKNCTELIKQTKLSSVQSLCTLLDYCLPNIEACQFKSEEENTKHIKQWFIFCLLWSVFATTPPEIRPTVDGFIRDFEANLFPPDDSVFDYCVDAEWGGFVQWTDKFPSKYTYDPSVSIQQMNIPTMDLTRHSFITSAFIAQNRPVLLTGHTGTGKSLVARHALNGLDKEIFATVTINSTSQRTRSSFLEMIGKKLEKRHQHVFTPSRGKRLVTLLENIDVAPRSDNIQPTLEVLRQWIEHGCWVDVRNNLATIKNVQLVATLRHGGYQHTRLLRHFSVLEISNPSDNVLQTLFIAPLAQHLLGFGEQIKLLGGVLVSASIEMYKSIKSKLAATPTNSHYVFNLKNLTEVVQGLLLSSKDHHNTKSAMCKLWIHENCRVYCDRITNLKDRLWFIREVSRQVSAHFGLSTLVLCPGKRFPLFVHVLNDATSDDGQTNYVETSTEDEQERLEKLLAGSHAVMFREAAEHVARMSRVLLRSDSHLLLLGQAGCGRHSLIKLACRVCHIQLVYAEVSCDPRDQVTRFREQMRHLVRQAAILGQKTALLLSDHQVYEGTFLDIINNIILPGHIYDLFDAAEIIEIYNELGVVDRGGGECIDSGAASQYIEERMHKNLHIILCFDHETANFREKLKEFPALTSCAMDYFSEWSKDALLQVAKKYLTKLDLGDKQGIVDTVANLFARFHETVMATVESINLRISITPAHYLDCLKTYTLLVHKKQTELREKTKTFKEGLKKIEETRQSVETMAEELLRAQRCVLERQRQCETALVTLGQRRREVEEQCSALETSEKQLALEEAAAQQLARLAHAAMEEAVPSLEDADMALDSLTQKDVADMRSYGRPPDAVELAMSAVLILKQAEPTWVEAKRQLADANFIEQLQNFDKDHIPDKILKSISSFTSNPEFNPDKIGIVSHPAKFLAQWVISIEKYARIYRAAAPKRAKLDRASRELRDRQAEISDLQTRLEHLNLQLEDQKIEYENLLQTKDTLNSQAEEMGAKLQRANQLVSSLGTDEDAWREHTERSASYEELLIGDCLVVSAIISYCGPFSCKYRQQLQRSLCQLMQEASVEYSPEISASAYLTNPDTLMEWRIQRLPRDSFTADSAVIALQNCLVPSDSPSPLCRWPLIVDPQGVALTWLRLLTEFQDLRVIDQRKANFAQIVCECVEMGYPLIIEKVEEYLDPVLLPLLIKNLIKYGNEQPRIKIFEKDIIYNSKFRLIFRTLLQNPTFGPEMTSRVNVIDFTIQRRGLEEMLLDVLTSIERPTLEEEATKLSKAILAEHQNLQQLENSILRILTKTPGTLLDHGKVMESLENNKSETLATCDTLNTYQEQFSEAALQKQSYLPCALRAATLFEVQTDLQQLNPVYKFSLNKYLEEYKGSIESSAVCQMLSSRLTAINKLHTYNFYQHTSQVLKEKHKLPFAFLICVRLKETENKIQVQSQLGFIAQQLTMKSSDFLETLNPCSAWLQHHIWRNICKLEEFDPIFYGISQHIIDFKNDWKLWITNIEPEELPLPDKYESLDEMNSLLLVACLRPDRLINVMQRFILTNEGSETFHDSPIDFSTKLDNNISILLPGACVDLFCGLEHLAKTPVHVLCVGQGQLKLIQRQLKSASLNGECVILSDCHLSVGWLPQLEHILEHLSASDLHPNFRCWLLTDPHQNFPIGILQNTEKLNIERPKDLKLTIKRLNAEAKQDPMINQPRVLLYAILHATFLDRKHNSGWNCKYDFSDSDFLACSKLQSIVKHFLDDSQGNIVKLITNLIYYGRVSDVWDQRLLVTLTKSVFTDKAIFDTSNISRLDSGDESSGVETVDQRRRFSTIPDTINPDNYNLNQTSVADKHSKQSCIVQKSLKNLFSPKHTEKLLTGENIEKVLLSCTLILEIMPEEIDIKLFKTSLNVPKAIETVLLCEINNYNAIILKIRNDVTQLQKATKGYIFWSDELQNLYLNIASNQLPPQWTTNPEIIRTDDLVHWCKTLSKKITQLQEWTANLPIPGPINLSILLLPNSLLSALMQLNVTHLTELENMTWRFTIAKQGDSIEEINTLKEGLTLEGLELENALWDEMNGHLSESQSNTTSRNMPAIILKPAKSSLQHSSDIYNCPCYSDLDHSRFLFSVPLTAGTISVDKLITRGVSLIFKTP